jgi:hypothetical protein
MYIPRHEIEYKNTINKLYNRGRQKFIKAYWYVTGPMTLVTTER